MTIAPLGTPVAVATVALLVATVVAVLVLVATVVAVLVLVATVVAVLVLRLAVAGELAATGAGRQSADASAALRPAAARQWTAPHDR